MENPYEKLINSKASRIKEIKEEQRMEDIHDTLLAICVHLSTIVDLLADGKPLLSDNANELLKENVEFVNRVSDAMKERDEKNNAEIKELERSIARLIGANRRK